MDLDKISMIAQTIIFSYEDLFHDETKKKLFIAFFEQYLSPLDPEGRLEIYDVIIRLARHNPVEFEQMLKEMEQAGLIQQQKK